MARDLERYQPNTYVFLTNQNMIVEDREETYAGHAAIYAPVRPRIHCKTCRKTAGD